MQREIMTVRVAAIGLLIGSLLMGLAHVAQLPPWEGFDETLHYSYLQQIAESGNWPRFGDPHAADIDAYLQVAPAALPLNPPWTYRSFFSAPEHTIALGRAAIHGAREERGWRPGQGVNWQAQHPPLYYLLMSPAYLVSKSWSLAAQLFWLRGLSYLIAWLALCVATFSTLGLAGDNSLVRSSLFLAPGLWPAVFPMWFPEMARLGNDSLVVLLAALAWLLLTRIDATDAGVRRHAALAVVCGLGLLTKATFLPFAAVTTCFLGFRAWQGRTIAAVLRRRLRGLMIFLVVVAVISGWWYVHKYVETGTVLGSHDMILLNRAGGMLEGLQQHGSLSLLISAIPKLLTSFLWAGTWSFVAPPWITWAPLILTTLLLGGGYAWQVVVRPQKSIAWVPLLTLAVFLAALINQSLVYIAAYGFSGGLAWYLHSFAPVLAVLVGLGLSDVMTRQALRPLLCLLMFYPLIFLVFAFTLQGLFYAGCGDRPGRYAYSDLLPFLACTSDLPLVFERLSVLSFPAAALAFFVAGLVLMSLGVAAAVWTLSRMSSRQHSWPDRAQRAKAPLGQDSTRGIDKFPSII